MAVVDLDTMVACDTVPGAAVVHAMGHLMADDEDNGRSKFAAARFVGRSSQH